MIEQRNDFLITSLFFQMTQEIIISNNIMFYYALVQIKQRNKDWGTANIYVHFRTDWTMKITEFVLRNRSESEKLFRNNGT